MEILSKIIQSRGTPGILIFDLAGRLVFSNQVAMEMQLVQPAGETGEMTTVSHEIRSFCALLVGDSERQATVEECDLDCQVLTGAGRFFYSVRPFLIGNDDGGLETHLLFLVERVVRQHEVDLEKSGREFGLTKREAEVAGLVCCGCSNKEISDRLFISEFTVKNHMKRIMKRVGAVSRSQIFSLLQRSGP